MALASQDVPGEKRRDPGELRVVDRVDVGWTASVQDAMVTFDDSNGEFGYRDPRGDRALLELAPVPSWHELQFRR